MFIVELLFLLNCLSLSQKENNSSLERLNFRERINMRWLKQKIIRNDHYNFPKLFLMCWKYVITISLDNIKTFSGNDLFTWKILQLNGKYISYVKTQEI